MLPIGTARGHQMLYKRKATAVSRTTGKLFG